MQIEKLFKNLSNNQKLIFYLFEHRDREILLSEVEEICKDTTIEILENIEIVELSKDKIFLDGRVINFLDEYLDGSDTIEISLISEKIANLTHKIEILREHKSKQKELIPKIRRELKKIDFILFQNLNRLRIHVDRVYKSTDIFTIKIKELKYYKKTLDEFSRAINTFDTFLFSQQPTLKSFYNSELNILMELIYQNKMELIKSLIPLTQDVIEYINQAQHKNIFIEKVMKLKEFKDSLELKSKTNILSRLESFDTRDSAIKILTRLDDEILRDGSFKPLLQKISSKLNLKTKKTTNIIFHDTQKIRKSINISSLNLQFLSSKLSLIEFLLNSNSLKDKSIDEVSELYCKMLLLYEDRYNITSEKETYQNITFRSIFYDNNTR